jgi:hypothetical protein
MSTRVSYWTLFQYIVTLTILANNSQTVSSLQIIRFPGYNFVCFCYPPARVTWPAHLIQPSNIHTRWSRIHRVVPKDPVPGAVAHSKRVSICYDKPLLASHRPNLQAAGPHVIGCPRLLINFALFLVAVLCMLNLRMCHSMAIMGTIYMS